MNLPHTEIPVLFDCGSHQLAGILHTGDCKSAKGVLFVVGGGQYRVGAHRQFVLLARSLSKAGLSVFRFDVQGMGDSAGNRRKFTELDEDINNAIDFFMESNAHLDEIIIWGLCDAASASIFYAVKDPRVKGIVMVNPWITTEKGAANTQLKHYYLSRFSTRSFWRAFMQGHVTIVRSFKSLLKIALVSVMRNNESQSQISLPERVFNCIDSYKGRVLIVLSGNDLTAREFEDAMIESKRANRLSDESSLTILKHDEADHTFSSELWRNDLEAWTKNWIYNLP